MIRKNFSATYDGRDNYEKTTTTAPTTASSGSQNVIGTKQ